MRDSDKNLLQAVALRYDRRPTSTPEIVAGGRGDLAQQIISAAQEAGVDIVQDPDLLEVLGQIPVGEEVPAELFQAVAEILAFIYRINGRYATDQS
ncbi:EscU/YscU/HrcU family type III secretion system export apparatus switch protein [uncultured Desulfuromusa sp.]|uniref:EscU/YscU/HrcU family type III secretion system export apparatus switch protein n=1 Tax=uncultured Desulfuromusa sp. TaxID=219183 RepID=UPI002AA6D37C|nr:EscU/YscU/HrcU family type III secretion system export apparatus switch protein [uncultured Desulfuromusa sp.]